MNKNSADVKGCTMYVALFPCNECAKLIIQAGESVSELVFLTVCVYHDMHVGFINQHFIVTVQESYRRLGLHDIPVLRRYCDTKA